MCRWVMAAEQARHVSGRMPVVVCPSQLDFYLDQQESHKQVLTLYNINDFSVRFQLLSNAPRRYAVAEPEGVLKPHSFTDVVVRHREALEGNVGRRDHLRIIMCEEGGRLHGHRDVPATLRPARSRGDEPLPTSSVPLEPSPGTERQLSRGAANGPSAAVVVVALACLVALLLPLEGASSSSHPYLQLTHQQKLIAAYILGRSLPLLLTSLLSGRNAQIRTVLMNTRTEDGDWLTSSPDCHMQLTKFSELGCPKELIPTARLT
ncbi:motile sperm domain-containing protein 1 [Rhipicephalus sanguineus]|uniref:motile sperm domain-containing protein 1 n=1 Tax=Rhipicephalus sanguineus TaxID=34632 RepID=UPI001894C320|nr:motile sperm domain-containing protein 1 [Rhipicephalus sanguineus]